MHYKAVRTLYALSCIYLISLKVTYCLMKTGGGARSGIDRTEWINHGLINYKDTKSNCRLIWCLIEFIDWRYSQSCWYFRPSFVNNCPSNLLSSSPPHLYPLPKVKVQNIQTVCGWEGVGVLSCVGDSVSDQIQNLQNCYTTPNKT